MAFVIVRSVILQLFYSGIVFILHNESISNNSFLMFTNGKYHEGFNV
jgi:hypothetical protein